MDELRAVAAQIVAAYVKSHTIGASDVPDLIRTVHRALSRAEEPVADRPRKPFKLTAAEIRKSLSPDFIVSFEDGKSYKSMKRHLGLRGLTPDQYRAKWGLPKAYPIVAPSYSAARSALAKSMGLGSSRVSQGASLKLSPRTRQATATDPSVAITGPESRPRRP